MSEDFFSDENKAKSSWFKFQTVGDAVKGMYIGKYFKEGRDNLPDQTIYELKTEDGEIVKVGFSIDKNYVHDRMKNIAFGRVVGFKFMDELKSKTKGFAPAKSIEVFAGGEDSRYAAEKIAEETGGTVMDEPDLTA